MAVAAATGDPRFNAVSPGVLARCVIEFSVLGPITVVHDPGEIVVGCHGLIAEQGSRRGLLLPQVATEYGWDRDAFLERTCGKAGLPPDAWKGATIAGSRRRCRRRADAGRRSVRDPTAAQWQWWLLDRRAPVGVGRRAPADPIALIHLVVAGTACGVRRGARGSSTPAIRPLADRGLDEEAPRHSTSTLTGCRRLIAAAARLGRRSRFA
jgi:hypothetical protein